MTNQTTPADARAIVEALNNCAMSEDAVIVPNKLFHEIIAALPQAGEVEQADKDRAVDLAHDLGISCEDFTSGASDILVRHLRDHRTQGTAAEALELRLCEASRIQLQPNRAYIFTVDPDCRSCMAAVGREKRPFAHCCAEAGGRIEHCDCVNKDHGFAWFDVTPPSVIPAAAVGEGTASDLWKGACIGREGYCSSDLQDAAKSAITAGIKRGFNDGWLVAHKRLNYGYQVQDIEQDWADYSASIPTPAEGLTERSQIVAWLRGEPKAWDHPGYTDWAINDWYADAIERGDFLAEKDA